MRILAVVVRYRLPLEESETVQGLCSAFQSAPELARSIKLLIWDNGPAPLERPQLPIPFEHRYTGENLGVSGAYNRALEIAEANGCPWMLLLDQDTNLDSSFLKRMLEYSEEAERNQEICCVAPFVRSHGELVSPRVLGPFHRVSQVDRGFSGVLRANAFSINSASLMRVSALREIGGYSDEFWLDFSDLHAFQRLHQNGKCVYVAGDLELNHSVAAMNFEHDMVPARYKAFLSAENAYLEMYRSRAENAFQTFRLFARSIHQFLKYKNREYARITWQCFLFRLFTPRAARLRYWREFLLTQRHIDS